MNNIPLVSILIPVYNREKLIGSCIQSALDQTVKNIEVIVVDNASTDNTWEICKNYAQKDVRVRIFRNEENIGPVRNCLRCIQEAKGKFGKILFSDDLIKEQYLEKTVPILEDHDIGFVFTKVCIGEIEWEGDIWYEYFTQDALIDTGQYITDCIINVDKVPVSPGCALFRRDDLNKNLHITIPSPTIDDFDKHGAGPDLLLYLLSAVCYKKVAYINDTLAFFRSHPGSITISDRGGYLNKCYLQAKIWFAGQYYPELLEKKLIQAWNAEKKKKLIDYKEFIKQYTTDNSLSD